MSICATDIPARSTGRGGGSLAWLGRFVISVLASTSAAADDSSPLEDTTLHVDAALRGTAVFESPPYGDDGFTSFFDQYRYVATENQDVPWHLDFRRLQLAWERVDGTRPLEVERESRGWLNERGGITMRLPSVEATVDYSRYRTGELRLFPSGTGAAIGVFGTTFNPDVAPSNPLGEDRRLSIRRNRVGGAVSMPRPERSETAFAAVEARAYADYERRTGRRQDRFLVEPNLAISDTDRFRARRRELDQEAVTVGLEATTVAAKRLTTKLDVRFEGFREREGAYRYRTLANDVTAIPLSGNPLVDDRAFRYVPDTDRVIASLSTAGRVGPNHLRLSGHFSHLRQSGAGSPVQRLNGLGEHVVNEGSVRGVWRVPITRQLDLSSQFNARWRENRVGRQAISQSTLFFVQEQTNAYLKRRREVTASSELRFRPRSGSTAMLGFRIRDVHRRRAFGFGFTSIPDAYNLIEQTSRNLRIYAEGRQRIGRAMRGSVEAGYEWSPEVGLVREPEEAFYVGANLTASLTRPRPISLSLRGKVRRRTNDEIALESTAAGGSRQKAFSQLEWSYGATATVLAPRDVQVVGTFHHSRDQQRFDHVRSDLPRNSGIASLRFYRDSTPELRSDLKTLSVTTRAPVFDSVEASLSGSATWFDAGYLGGGQTGQILDSTNRIRARILGLESGLTWTSGEWSVGATYRFDDFDDRVGLGPLERDVSVHTGWVQIAYRR